MNQPGLFASAGASHIDPAAMIEALARQPSVLLVEDDGAVRQAMADTLRDAGFDVVEAGNAADAIRLLEQHREFQVMITDIHMPGQINGYFLARKVRERWPYVEVLMVSGYAAPARRDLDLDCDFLFKPFGSVELVGHVSTLARRAT